MSLDLLCFCTDPVAVPQVVAGGVQALVVDWERGDKDMRQHGHDTQISSDTPEDLLRVRAATAAPVICRINRVGEWTAAEVEQAVAGGATELLVPMARHVGEVEQVIALAGGRALVGALIETEAAVAATAQFAQLPISRLYVGLNDLRIERGLDTIFDPFLDGTVQAIRDAAGLVPFGVGGLTVPGAGAPVPAELLLGEIVRLDCDFTFLRRSFWQAAGQDPAAALRQIRGAIERAQQRSPQAVEDDRSALEQVLRRLLTRV